MNYITVNDVQAYMGSILTGNGINVFNLIQQPMQDLVDLYCNRTWSLTNPIIETFNAYKDTSPAQMEDTFTPLYVVDTTPCNSSFPQAGGIRSITIGNVNGAGGTPIDLTYVYNYKTSIKISTWFAPVPMFNPLAYKSVEIVYNSSDAGALPGPVKLALLEWMARKIKTSPDSNKNAKEVMTGNIRVYYQEDKFGEIPDFVRFVLDKYRFTPLTHF